MIDCNGFMVYVHQVRTRFFPTSPVTMNEGLMSVAAHKKSYVSFFSLKYLKWASQGNSPLLVASPLNTKCSTCGCRISPQFVRNLSGIFVLKPEFEDGRTGCGVLMVVVRASTMRVFRWSEADNGVTSRPSASRSGGPTHHSLPLNSTEVRRGKVWLYGKRT